MRKFFKRNILWVGFLAVLAPLSVLLSFQYLWLVDLSKKSAIAQEATLKNYLETVAAAVEYFYRASAVETLTLPSGLFTEHHLDKAAYYFEKKRASGARTLFLLSLWKDDWGKLLVYEPSIPSMEPPVGLSESQALYVALSPWQALANKEAVLDSVGPTVDERDPNNRVILYPIVDDSSRLVGVTGMVVDNDFFKESLLPGVIKSSLPAFFSEHDREDLIVRVRDGKEAQAAVHGEVRKWLTYVYTDHQLGLSNRSMRPQAWAHASFLLNISLSVLLSLVLLGGVALALRAASREMRLSQMKSDFVSNVSHELRTPLASIRVFGEFLRLGRAATPDKVREYGEYVETESRRLTGLVDNILDFARIESGRKTYDFEPADVRDVVESTLRGFEMRLKHSGFRISLEAPEGPLPPASIDAEAISQAVGNLLDNAVKYSGGSKEIAVDLGRRDGWIVISVRDHGIGISRDEQKKVFERFHRVSTGLVHDVKGSGLGLSIVSHIVQAHGGRVTLESDPGKGSTFSISLPVAPEEDHA